MDPADLHIDRIAQQASWYAESHPAQWNVAVGQTHFTNIIIPRYGLSCTGDPLFCDHLNSVVQAGNVGFRVAGTLLSVDGPA